MKKFTLLTAFIFFIVNLMAQQLTQTVSFTTNDLSFTQKNSYDVVSLPATNFIRAEELAGQPQLPIKTISILLPQGAKATAIAIQTSLTELAGTYNLYPIQPPTLFNNEEPPVFVAPDPAFYNSNTAYPQDKLYGFITNQYREYSYVTVSFCPFSYDPQNQKLSLATNVSLIVDYAVDSSNTTYKLRPYNKADLFAYNNIKNKTVNGNDVIVSFYPDTQTKIEAYNTKVASTVQSKAFRATDLPALAGSEVRYVIITNDTDIYGNPILNNSQQPFLVNKFKEFADYKTQMGSTAKVVTIDAIRANYQGVDIPEKIREFIKDAVRLWNTEYVLLGGTANIVPVRYAYFGSEGLRATDLYYSAINGNNWNADGDSIFGEIINDADQCDFTPDIAVGRTPIDTEEEIDTFLEKNYYYARRSDIVSNIPTGEFLNQQLNIGGIVSSEKTWPDPTTTWNAQIALPTFWYIETQFTQDATHPYGSEQYTMLEYRSDWETYDSTPDDGIDNPDFESWAPAYNPSVNGDIMDAKICNDDPDGINHDDIVAYIDNNKPGFIFHIDHSGPHSEGLTQTIHHNPKSLEALDWYSLEGTSHKYPIMMSGGCETAPVERSYFVGGEWLNAEGGGVAYIGTTVTVPQQVSYSTSQSFFDVLYDPDTDIRNIGDIMNEATSLGYQLTQTISPPIDFVHLHQRIYQLLGDPELMIYTDNPADTDNIVTVQVTPDPNTASLTTGNQDIYVKASWPSNEDPYATISVFKDDEVLAIQEKAYNGVNYMFNITPDTTTGDISIIVTRHNADPVVKSLAVTSNNPTVHLYNYEITALTDENGNDEIEPGENISFKIKLKNTGSQTATDINTVLSITGGDAVMNESNSGFENIDSNFVKESIDTYSFTAGNLTNDTDYGKVIPFELQITTNQGSFTETFFLNVKNAKLDIGDREVLVNGNPHTGGNYSDGDAIDLSVDIHNYSNIAANITQAILSVHPDSDIQNVTISNPNQPYGVIGGFGVENKTFHLTMNENCASHNTFKLVLTLTDNFGNERQFDINLTETEPPLIEGFDFISEEETITLKWRNAHFNQTTEEWEPFENIKGNNIYRLNEDTNEYEKINDFILTSPIFYDTDRSIQNIYQYKISVVSETGNEKSIASLTPHQAWTSLLNHASFPKTASVYAANYSAYASPTVCDVTGDGNKEIFSVFRLSDTSRIMAYKQDGSELFDIDATNSEPTGFAEIAGRTYHKQAIGNMDIYANKEIITFSEHNKVFNFHSTDANHDNNPDTVWSTPLVTQGIISDIPVLADLNNDGKMELIVVNKYQQSANTIPDIFVYNNDKELLWFYDVPVATLSSTDEYSGLSNGKPAIADLNNDGLLDIVIGFKRNIDAESVLYIFLNTTSGGTLSFDDYDFPMGNNYSDTPIIIDDIDNDDQLDIIFSTNRKIYALEADGTEKWVYTFPATHNFTPHIVVGDIDFDGNKEVISTYFSSGIKEIVSINASDGLLSEDKTIDLSLIQQSPLYAPILADIDEDDDMEIIITLDGVIFAFNPDGSECPYWRLGTGVPTNPILSSPFIGDIDKNGISEVVAIASNCETYVWKTTGDAGRIAWGSQRANPQNTGASPTKCEIQGPDYVVDSNETFNNNTYFSGNLIIKNNSTLTINAPSTDVDISFTEYGKIIIESGSKLILGGGPNMVTLKSECGTHWQGIRVEGNASVSQSPESNQGVLEINGNVTIQDADIAIYVGGEEAKMNRGEDLSVDETWNAKAGGIIKIDGANFINNVSGIEIPSYRDGSLPNHSFIKNSIFKTTPDYNHTENPDAFVTLWGVNKITIEGNIFKNETLIQDHQYNSNLNKAGKGIVATDADLIIKPNPDDENSYNHFENLRYAIYAQGTGSSNDIEIKGNSFLTNYNNIRIENIDNAQIIDNDIEVFLSTGVYFPSIYLKNSDDFLFEENNIHGPTSYNLQAIDENGDNSGPFGMGVWLDNCHTSNELYKNIFNKLFLAIIITGTDTKEYDIASSVVSNGLKIICNTFDDVKSDIYIEPASFINTNQGTSTKEAGNTFTTNEPYGGFEIFSRDKQLTYFHRDDISYIPQDTYHVTKVNYAGVNNCPSRIDRKVKEEDISNKEAEINQDRSNLLAITDGGDTEALNETVDEADDDEALSLRNELLSQSPSLSDTVMINATNREDVLPSLMLKQVLAANPKAAKSEKIQTALNDRQNQLPDYMRAEIDLGKNMVSYKERLESVLSQDLYDYEYLVNKRMSQLKEEGSVSSLDSLETMLSNEANTKLNRAYQLVDFYLSRDNIAQAQNVFTAIPTSFVLSSKQQTKYDKLNQLYSIRFSLENANKSWFEMSASQKGVIETLAIDSTTVAGMQARSVLSLVNHIDYNLYMPTIDTSINQSYSYSGAPEMLFKAYPEVATDYFIIEYVLGENENPEEVSIAVFDDKNNQLKDFDVTNYENQFLVECENWKEGVYWCRKTVGKKVTEQRKVFINKNGVVIDSIDANSIKGTNSLVLFPNPSSDYLFVSFNIPSEISGESYYITITDVKGTLIGEYKLENNLTQIATDKWQQGVYIVSIMANKEIVDTAKIIVE